jgi:hypothetical protein
VLKTEEDKKMKYYGQLEEVAQTLYIVDTIVIRSYLSLWPQQAILASGSRVLSLCKKGA